MLNLSIVLLLFVTGCAITGFKPQAQAPAVIPPWPKAGPAVAAELDRVCPIEKREDGTEVSSCPAIDDWMARLDRYRQKLEAAR